MTTIDRAFRVATLATALLSFTALVLTASPHPGAAAFVYFLITLSLFRNRLPWNPPEWFWALVCMVALGAFIHLAPRDTTLGLLIFVMALKVGKIWSLQTNRDYVWLYVICFCEVVFATLFTTSMILMFVFIGFGLAFCAVLVLFSCKCEFERAQASGAILAYDDSIQGVPALSRRFARRCATIGIAVLVTTVGLFIVIPRSFEPRMLHRAFGPESDLLSGFEEDVDLDDTGDIELDDTVVLRVHPVSPGAATDFQNYGVRLRGVSLWAFDGTNWVRVASRYGRGESVSLSTRVDFGRAVENDRLIESRIYLEPRYSRYIFSPTMCQRLEMSGTTHMLVDHDEESIRFYKRPGEGFWYRAWHTNEPDPDDLSDDQKFFSMLLPHTGEGGVKDPMLSRRSERYLGVPAAIGSSPQFVDLALALATDADSAYDVCRNVERYLAGNYQYTLGLDDDATSQPVLSFLFDRRMGHCELYASAMAMLLRQQGIPSRIVNGFLSYEWNPISEHIVVRQEHAHSWVEGWIDGYGWKTFDPTPPGYSGDLGAVGWVARFFGQHIEAMRFRWHKYVIDYGVQEQSMALAMMADFVGEAHAALREAYAPIHFAFTARPGDSIARVSALWTLIFVAAGLIFTSVRLEQLRRSSVLRRRAARAPRAIAAALEAYERVLKQLRKTGHRRASAQTLLEFANDVAASNPGLGAFRDVTRLYYDARFGGRELDADSSESIREFARSVPELSRERRA